jgi:hypothetical protein
MNQHKYLRAYMAGIVIPTIILLLAVTAFTFYRYVYNVPVPVERLIIFPMAVVPNLWGLWNILHAALPPRLRLSLGFHGALLPLLLMPLAIALVGILNFPVPPFVVHIFPVAAPIALIGYYLVWKYPVAFLNRVAAID